MAYTTEAIIRVESPFKDTTNINTTYVARAIAEADALIDSMISQVYTLPLDETPTLIQNISTTLATIFLFKDQNSNIEISSGVDVEAALSQALDTLRSIAKREIKLLDSTGTELATNSTRQVSSYPTQSSTDSDDTNPLFEIAQKF